jgi:hypothetical protein
MKSCSIELTVAMTQTRSATAEAAAKIRTRSKTAATALKELPNTVRASRPKTITTVATTPQEQPTVNADGNLRINNGAFHHEDKNHKHVNKVKKPANKSSVVAGYFPKPSLPVNPPVFRAQ